MNSCGNEKVREVYTSVHIDGLSHFTYTHTPTAVFKRVDNVLTAGLQCI